MSQTFVDKLTVNLELLRCAELMDKCGIRLDINNIKEKSRKRELVFQRAVVVFILTKKGYSVPKQAFILGRDHSTVLHAQKYAKFKIGRDERYPVVCDTIEAVMGDNWSKELEHNLRILKEIGKYKDKIEELKKQLTPNLKLVSLAGRKL